MLADPRLVERIQTGRPAGAPADLVVDRSTEVFRVAKDLFRLGWEPAWIAGVLSDERYGIADHAYDQRDRLRAAWRAVDHAEDSVERDLAFAEGIAGPPTDEDVAAVNALIGGAP
jgi:hypothetical protein